MYKNRMPGFKRRMKATALAVLTAAGGLGLFGGSVCFAEKLDGENEDASDFLTECGQPPFPKHVIIIVFFDFGLFAFFCVIEKSGGYCGGIARDTGRMNIC